MYGTSFSPGDGPNIALLPNSCNSLMLVPSYPSLSQVDPLLPHVAIDLAVLLPVGQNVFHAKTPWLLPWTVKCSSIFLHLGALLITWMGCNQTFLCSTLSCSFLSIDTLCVVLKKNDLMSSDSCVIPAFLRSFALLNCLLMQFIVLTFSYPLLPYIWVCSMRSFVWFPFSVPNLTFPMLYTMLVSVSIFLSTSPCTVD